MFSIKSMFYIVAIISLASGEIIINKNNHCIISEYEDVEPCLQKCTNIIVNSVTVPAGKELTLNIKNETTLTFRGNISFEHKYWTGPLIYISGSNFVIKGDEGSILEGNGHLYWDGLGTWGSTIKPKFLKINAVNATIENVKLHNCPIVCVMIRGSDNLTIRNWLIDNLDGDEGVAPSNKFGHNTDGFTVGGTSNLLIEDTTIYNQDDCVAITSGENITVRNMFCHGSHGLPINGEGEILKNVLISNSIITNAENGIHIKTHVGSPPGLLQNITYKDITILDSKYYGVNIQQNYKSLPAGVPIDGPPENSVKIYDLKFDNIYGNVQYGAVPVFILCADEGCFDWQWHGVEILGVKSSNCTGYLPDGFSCHKQRLV